MYVYILDIDECAVPGTCSQECRNTEGSYKCHCTEGYEPDPHDDTRCKASDGHASLLFTHRKDVRKISIDKHEMTSIVNNTRFSIGIDYVFRMGIIFWSDRNNEKIYK